MNTYLIISGSIVLEDVQKLVEIVKSKKDKKEVLKECLILI
jgi:hypothetical protein